MEKPQGKKHRAKAWVSAALLISAVALLVAARKAPGFAEWYSATVYPALVGSLGRLTGLLPVSAAELLCAALPLLLVIDIIRAMLRKKRGHPGLRHAAFIFSLLLFLYAANCGVNYYRDPFVPAGTYADAEFSVDELEDFCVYITDRLAETPASGYPERAELAAEARAAVARLSAEYDELAGYYPIPKQLTFLSPLFSMSGVSGVYSPFTIEANINGEMPGMEKPFTACHELSHLRGYMDEGEANYIGWLACIGSDDAAFNRSGWLIAWNYAGSSLYRADPERYAEVYALLPEDASAELHDNHMFWETHENKASDIQNDINDAYLKSNGQEGGIATYGRLTTLMLCWYTANSD